MTENNKIGSSSNSIFSFNVFSIFDFKTIETIMIENKVFGTMIGLILAQSTGGFIHALVGDILLPFCYFFIVSPIYVLYIKKTTADIHFNTDMFAPAAVFDFSNFIKELISFILVIITVMFGIQYMFMRIIEEELKKGDLITQDDGTVQILTNLETNNTNSQQLYNHALNNPQYNPVPKTFSEHTSIRMK